MEEIEKKQKLKMEKCPICKQEITGHTEPQVRSRMRMHMMTHEEKVGYYVHQVMDSVHDRREYEDCRVFLEDCVVAVREIVKEEV